MLLFVRRLCSDFHLQLLRGGSRHDVKYSPGTLTRGNRDSALVTASYAGSLADTSSIGCSSVRRASRTVGLVMGGGIYAPVTAERAGAGVGTTMWVCMNRSGRGGTGPGRQRGPAGRPRAGAGEADYSYSTVPVSMLRYNGRGVVLECRQ